MILYFFILIFILLTLIFYKNEKYSNNLLNIYNEPLQSCSTGNMSNGSWDNKGKCSEIDGGVHQICIKNISKNAPNFSKNTGQSNWSNLRNDNNHCVCLGAWSLYNSKNKEFRNNNVLNCDAIPNNSLSKRYVSKFSEGWNKWNGLEINDQIKDGIDSLMKNCHKGNINKKNNLIKNFCKLASEVDSLKSLEFYNKC